MSLNKEGSDLVAGNLEVVEAEQFLKLWISMKIKKVVAIGVVVLQVLIAVGTGCSLTVYDGSAA